MSALTRSRPPVRQARLHLEELENRFAPANLLLLGGNLTVSNPRIMAGTANLQLNQQADGRFQILDQGFSLGLYRVTGSITVRGSNAPNSISVTLNDSIPGNGVLYGNLSIYGGNGNDTISVDGTAGTENIRGSLYVDAGFGNDTVNVGTSVGLTVRGSATLIGNLGNDSAVLGGGANPTTVRGALALYSTQQTTLSGTTVRGGLLDTLQLSPSNTSMEFSSLSLAVSNNSVLQGTTTVNAGVLTDQFTSDATSTLGRTIINAPGTDTLDLAGTVNGSFTLNGGNGNTTVTIEAGTAINAVGTVDPGNLTLNLGNGSNTYTLGNPFTVQGSVSLSAGNSDQTISSFDGMVGGSLSINWGSGNDSFALASMVGGNLSFVGTGNDTVSVNLGALVVGTINDTIANGGSDVLDIGNDNAAANNVVINVPTTPGGGYMLAINFTPGGSANLQKVTLNGASSTSTGTITIDWNFDPRLLTNSLAAGNTISVVQLN
jgi:fibronectin-binding autotransporter adhesin